MTPDRWQRIEQLYHGALERPEGERSAYLRDACADDAELRKEVEELLHNEGATGFLENPALEGAADDLTSDQTEALVGRTLGRYAIVSFVGRGGMGEVYRARDTRLDRDVAVKILPHSLAAIPGALRRFEREAKAVAALSHPNILAIFDLGIDQNVTYEVMELLEGETLRELLVRGAPKWQRAVEVGIDIAEGLAAAHAKQIIHRDLKPANVFLTTDGRVKILDFGLARVTRIAQAGDIPAAAESTLTHSGILMGTVGYMSPEQVCGEPAGPESDVFSVGCVLYEMLSGSQPFKRGQRIDTLAAVLRDDPPPLTAPGQEMPDELLQVVARCLAKKPETRFPSGRELAAALRSVLGASDQPRSRSSPKLDVLPHHAPGVSPSRKWYADWRVLSAAAFVVIVAGSIIAWYALAGRTGRPPDVRLQRLTANSVERPVLGAALSPGGKYLAWADEIGIHLKLLATSEDHVMAKPTTLTADDIWTPVSWFPDGTRIIANSLKSRPEGPRAGIWVVPTLGGTPSQLRENALSGAISPDGTLIAFLAGGSELNSEIWLMGTRGENAYRLATAQPNDFFGHLHWSPDGRQIGYVKIHYTTEGLKSSVESMDLKVGKNTVILPSSAYRFAPAPPGGTLSTDFCWLADGRILYPVWEPEHQHDENLWAIQVDAQSGRPRGKARQVTNSSGLSFDNFSLSTDGRSLAFQKTANQAGIYVARRPAGGTRLETPRRLTVDEYENVPTAWTPDSKAILFASNRKGHFGVFKQALNADIAEPLVDSAEQAQLARVSPDGCCILYVTGSTETGSGRIMRVPMSGGVPHPVLEWKRAWNYECANLPSTTCMIEEASVDLKEVIFTAFDVVRGRGREIFRLPLGRGEAYESGLSADGARIAALRVVGQWLPQEESQQRFPNNTHIQLFSISGHHERDIVVSGWTRLNSIGWDSDSKALLIGSQSLVGASELRVDLTGHVQVLWTQKGVSGAWAIASPDGKYLALWVGTSDRNVWMLENF